MRRRSPANAKEEKASPYESNAEAKDEQPAKPTENRDEDGNTKKKYPVIKYDTWSPAATHGIPQSVMENRVFSSTYAKQRAHLKKDMSDDQAKLRAAELAHEDLRKWKALVGAT